MSQPSPYRELLLADLALVLGIAPARDVALALQRFWERRDEPDASLLEELQRIAELTEEQLHTLVEEAERAISEAGDARLALGARGGIDRTIHMEISAIEAPLVRALTEAGAGARSPLRIVSERLSL